MMRILRYALCCLLFLATTAYGRQRVLVVAELGGQHEAFTQAGLRWLHEKATEMDFEMAEVNDCRLLKAGDIARYDLIVQLNYPPYMWSDAAVSEFEQAVDEGSVAWVGFHHASLLGEFDGYPMWPWFSDFLGGIRFQNYIAAKADGEVRVEDAGHPVMAGVSPKFIIREDEWYTYDKNPRPQIHVLASVDEESYSPASDIRMGDHPVIWTNQQKKARNVYFQIGHSASLFDNPEFVRMFTNAICWGLCRPMPLYKSTMESGAAVSQDDAAAPDPIQLPLTGWQHEGLGGVSTQGDSCLVLAMPLTTGRRATGTDGDADYAIYGTCTARRWLDGRNLENYNLLSFDIRTDLDAGIANMNVVLENDPYPTLGAHLVNMQGREWQHVTYQISELPRNKVHALRLYTDLKGRNLSRLDTIHYYIRNLRLERTASPEPVSGWQVTPGRIAYSMSGYLPEGSKTAILPDLGNSTVRLVDFLTGDTVWQGEPLRSDSLCYADFSDFRREGIYRLACDTLLTEPFPISRDALTGSVWKMLNFIRCQRCGDAVAGIHGKCHTDVFCDHDGRSLSYGGGWHDAGDLSQQTLQTGDVAFALLEAYNSMKDSHPQLATLLIDEARHGLRQIVGTRFGDGWRASSIGLLHWTDGQTDTSDDIHSVRKQNLALDNYLYAAYEAYAALLLGDAELRRTAVEDFAFAEEKFLRDGVDTFRITMEHTYNTSDVTFMAAASWSASMLYRLTGEKSYAERAARYIGLVLGCQERAGDFAGYFYRDQSRRAIIHYIHQSREQLPIQALTALCESQPAHQDFPLWQQAVSRYGSYLKRICTYTRPWGMAPSGIYQTEEYLDEDGFSRLHLWAPDNARELYDAQLREGVRIDEHHYLRRFPVWFSIFNGNEAVILSTGKAAALCGRFLHDMELLDIAREQLYWTVGKNPFCQSLIYGEGYRYPSMDSFSSGEITGEIPVGIRSLGNTDRPYWPMTNNACYKEVWLTSAGKWLSLVSETLAATTISDDH